MLRSIRWIAPVVVALGLLVPYLAKAEDTPAASGTVSGTVKDADGKAVAGAHVAVIPADAASHKHKDNATKPLDDKGDGGQKHDKPKATAEGKTDADGKFTLPNVPAGEYEVMAGLKGKGRGHEKVTVEAGKTVSVDITLKEKPAKPAN